MRTIFTEHWKHARHRENERLWFTNIYAVVVAAILVFMGEIGFGQQTDLGPMFVLAVFGFILSVLGFMVVISLSLGYLHHITDIVMVFYRWDKMEFYRHPDKPVHFVNVHRWFYEITIALFGVLSLFCAFKDWTSSAVSHEHLIWPIVAFVTIFLAIETLYRWKWKKYHKKCHEFREVLRNDTEGYYRKDWDNWFKDPSFLENILKDATERNEKEA